MDALTPLLPLLGRSTIETLTMVLLTLLFGGLGGLVMGLGLYLTRGGSLLANRPVFAVLNVVVNTFRPIPFIIFLVAAQPLARVVTGRGIGQAAIIFTLSLAASFAISRIVEQNLLTVQPGVIPEALGPLILGYTFVFVGIVDMTAVAGAIGAGGLGDFAIVYGYRQFEPVVTWAAVLIIIVLVQVVQLIGNRLARAALRR
jgi:D-methionine transport system permease protein